MTRWSPLGHIYRTESYGQCPTPLVMQDRVRVYFSERNSSNRSHIYYVDLELDDPTKILHDPSGNPVLENGKPVSIISARDMLKFLTRLCKEG